MEAEPILVAAKLTELYMDTYDLLVFLFVFVFLFHTYPYFKVSRFYDDLSEGHRL